MSHTTFEPKVDDTGTSGRYQTLIFNNDHTAMDLVLITVMAATECSVEEAEIETWEAHHFGKAAVHFASKAECERVAQVISAIGVKTAVEPEWQD